jgi:hypothetical protein
MIANLQYGKQIILHPRYYLCFKVIQWHIVGILLGFVFLFS